MEEDEKKLGLGSVVSVSVGLVIATSCLVSLGQVVWHSIRLRVWDRFQL